MTGKTRAYGTLVPAWWTTVTLIPIDRRLCMASWGTGTAKPPEAQMFAKGLKTMASKVF